jgi:hypothetical protein
MRLQERLAAQGNRTLQTMRNVLCEVQNLSNPVVAATAAAIVGVAVGFSLSSLLASKDDEIRRLRTDADDLKRRIEKLGS